MNNKEIVYWKQKDGKLVSVDDMDTNHLRNVLKMIVNNSNKHKKKQEFKLNGDIAQQFNDSFHNTMFNDDESRGNQW
jgi:hypothetical protein